MTDVASKAVRVGVASVAETVSVEYTLVIEGALVTVVASCIKPAVEGSSAATAGVNLTSVVLGVKMASVELIVGVIKASLGIKTVDVSVISDVLGIDVEVEAVAVGRNVEVASIALEVEAT